jgi:hypothetical protein
MTIWDSLISLGALPSPLAACLVLLLDTLPDRNVILLAHYGIPSPIVGVSCLLWAQRCRSAPPGTKLSYKT